MKRKIGREERKTQRRERRAKRQVKRRGDVDRKPSLSIQTHNLLITSMFPTSEIHAVLRRVSGVFCVVKLYLDCKTFSKTLVQKYTVYRIQRAMSKTRKTEEPHENKTDNMPHNDQS